MNPAPPKISAKLIDKREWWGIVGKGRAG